MATTRSGPRARMSGALEALDAAFTRGSIKREDDDTESVVEIIEIQSDSTVADDDYSYLGQDDMGSDAGNEVNDFINDEDKDSDAGSGLDHLNDDQATNSELGRGIRQSIANEDQDCVTDPGSEEDHYDSDDDIMFPSWGGPPFYFAFTRACESVPGAACHTWDLEFNPSSPSHLFEDDYAKTWGLSKRLETIIAPKTMQTDIERMKQIADAPAELREELIEAYKAEKHKARTCAIVCPPCRHVIRDALIMAKSHPGKKLIYTIRIDDRLPTSCCTGFKKKFARLQTLAETLRGCDNGRLAESQFEGDDYILLKHVDLAYLEQRIHSLQAREQYNLESVPVSIKAQVSQLMAEQANHEGTVLYMGEEVVCSWIVNTHPFVPSPMPVASTQLFRFTPEWDQFAYKVTREYLGTFTCAVPQFDEGLYFPYRSYLRGRRAVLRFLSGGDDHRRVVDEVQMEDRLSEREDSTEAEEAGGRVAKRRRLVYDYE